MPLSDEDLARQLWAIGDIVRIRMLRLLPRSEDCSHGNNVSQLAKKLGLSQPTISHHLRILRQTRIVRYRKMCRDVFYWIDTQRVEDIHPALLEVLDENGEVAADAAPVATSAKLD